ncbi:hypothetical protein CJJ07_005324 [Candidozyma auris]|nr:hypothetical protein CJJ07_005324 [[Candida] auris]
MALSSTSERPLADDNLRPRLPQMSSDAPPFQGPQAEVGENRPPEHSQHHNSFHQQNFNQSSYQHQAPQNQNSQSQFPPAQDESKGANNASTASLGKTQTVFIHKLYDMLEDSSLSHLIWWSPTNDSFCLYPGEEFSNVLAQYFKHTNIASFIRQLNMYGFHKVNDSFHSDEKNAQGNNSSSGSGQTRWEFRHAANQFRKGDTQSLRLIKRKSSKVMSTPKEIVSLKSLPPTSNPSTAAVAAPNSSTQSKANLDSESSESPESASKQQYHRSLYQQSWKQQSAPKPQTPSSPNGPPVAGQPPSSNTVLYQSYPGVHPYPGFPHLTMPVPSINLKLIELSTSIASLRASYSDLQRKYDSLKSEQHQHNKDMVTLIELLENQEEPALHDIVNRSSSKTPVTSSSTPGPEAPIPSISRTSTLGELQTFKKHLLQRISEVSEDHMSEEVKSTRSSYAQAHTQGNPQGPEASSQGASNAKFVPQHYPLNPNYLLNNNNSINESGFRHYRLSKEDGSSSTTNSRHFSVLMDPLQTKAIKSGDESRPSISASSKDTRSMPIVQQYQPKVTHSAAPSLYQPFIRGDGAHQHRTASLPILDKVMPQAFTSQQRHSTTSSLPGTEERRPISPGHIVQPNKTYTSNPLGSSGHGQSPQAHSPAPTSQSPQPPSQLGEGKKVLPSVKELDQSIKRSASSRLSDLLSDDEHLTKKPKSEMQ